tara:strand:+ start:99 stop:389 length:291 start_codon:yes stop_codon:yes gene_type:complete
MHRTYLNENGGTVEVYIDNLVPDTQNPDDWVCDYKIVGLGKDISKKSYGTDGIQAVYLAMRLIQMELFFSDLYKSGKLRWEGEYEAGDLGLPKMPD